MTSNIDPEDLAWKLVLEGSCYFSFSASEMEELIDEVKRRLATLDRQLEHDEAKDIFEDILVESGYDAQQLISIAHRLELPLQTIDELTLDYPLLRVQKHFIFDACYFKRMNEMRTLCGLKVVDRLDPNVLAALYVTSFLVGQDEASIELENLLEEHGVDFWQFIAQSGKFLDAAADFEEEIPVAVQVVYMLTQMSPGIESRAEYIEILNRYGLANHPWVGLAAMQKFSEILWPASRRTCRLDQAAYEIFQPDPDEPYSY